MGSVKYSKMSLFDAPKGAIIAHGCNAQGVWGSGIAKPFKEKYPKAFDEYNKYCVHRLNVDSENGAVGHGLLTAEDNGHRVGCLITSFDFGPKKDNPGKIVIQTVLALKDLMSYLNTYQLLNEPIYCNKFNSGLFNVPWESTEKILQFFAKRYDLNFIVCDPDMKG